LADKVKESWETVSILYDKSLKFFSNCFLFFSFFFLLLFLLYFSVLNFLKIKCQKFWLYFLAQSTPMKTACTWLFWALTSLLWYSGKSATPLHRKAKWPRELEMVHPSQKTPQLAHIVCFTGFLHWGEDRSPILQPKVCLMKNEKEQNGGKKKKKRDIWAPFFQLRNFATAYEKFE